MAKKQPELKFIPQQQEGVFILEGSRLSFPNLFRPGKHKGALKPRLDSNFLLDAPNAKEVYKKIEKFYVSLAQEVDGSVKKLSNTEHPKVKKDKNSGLYVVQTTNATDRPPVYFNRDGEEIHDAIAAGAEKELYAGCYVRVKIKANGTQDSGSTKVWSNLEAIQFMAKGSRLGGGGMSGEALRQGFGAIDNDGFDDDDKKSKKSKGGKKSKGKKDKAPKDSGKKSKKGKKGKKSKDFDSDDLNLD